MASKELKKAGLKATIPRLRVMQVLETSHLRHLRAEDVYKTLLETGEDVGLATVYRVLSQFESAGLVRRHHFNEGTSAVFELNQGEHHDHMQCVHCGAIIEFVDDTIEQRQRQIAAEADFEITGHCLCLYGICRACRQVDPA